MENNQDNVILNGEPAESESGHPEGNKPQKGAYVNSCPVCGTPYTYACLKCGYSPYVSNKKAKKSIFTKWWFWLIAVLLMFSVITGSTCWYSYLTKTDFDEEVLPFCRVGEVEMMYEPEYSWRSDYEIVFNLQVKNSGDETICFYPIKATVDGEKILALCNYVSLDPSDYAEDESLILKSDDIMRAQFSFSSDDEETDVDMTKYKTLEFNVNIADPVTLEVLDTTRVTFDLSKIEIDEYAEE